MNKEKVFAWIESLEDMADQSDRYFVERTELYKENQVKDKEIERLNKELKEKKEIINKFIADENGGVSYKLQNENDRLNNIINELEKESHLGMLENQNNNDYAKGLYCAYEYINKKIKELKEGKNNEENN